jgi:hypothetical protein
MEPGQLGWRGGIGWEAEDRLDVEVSNEPFGIGRSQYDNPNVHICGEAARQLRQLDKHLRSHQVDRRVIDQDRGNAAVVDGERDG